MATAVGHPQAPAQVDTNSRVPGDPGTCPFLRGRGDENRSEFEATSAGDSARGNRALPFLQFRMTAQERIAKGHRVLAGVGSNLGTLPESIQTQVDGAAGQVLPPFVGILQRSSLIHGNSAAWHKHQVGSARKTQTECRRRDLAPQVTMFPSTHEDIPVPAGQSCRR